MPNKKDILYTMASIGFIVVLVALLMVFIDGFFLGLHLAISNPIHTIIFSLFCIGVIVSPPSKK